MSTISRELELDRDLVLEGNVVWESGLDSALLIELVLCLEDLGMEVSESVQWNSVTFGELYRLYVLARAI
jgi:hypothetical protein